MKVIAKIVCDNKKEYIKLRSTDKKILEKELIKAIKANPLLLEYKGHPYLHN